MANILSGRDFRFETLAKTPTYFFTGVNIVITEEIILELMDCCRSGNKGSARICLHDSPQAEFHEMVISAMRKKYFRPHCHPHQEVSLRCIKGEIAVILFSDDGKIINTYRLRENGIQFIRLRRGVFYTVAMVSEIATYCEAKAGRFSETNNFFPSWAPTEEGEHSAYLKDLFAVCKEIGIS